MLNSKPIHQIKGFSQTNAIKDLRQGQTIYMVFSQPAQCIARMSKHVLTGKAFSTKHGSAFFSSKNVEYDFEAEHSLTDHNFSSLQNTYNHHKIFTSRRKAEKYLKEQETLIEHYRVHGCPTMFDDFEDDWLHADVLGDWGGSDWDEGDEEIKGNPLKATLVGAQSAAISMALSTPLLGIQTVGV